MQYEVVMKVLNKYGEFSMVQIPTGCSADMCAVSRNDVSVDVLKAIQKEPYFADMSVMCIRWDDSRCEAVLSVEDVVHVFSTNNNDIVHQLKSKGYLACVLLS